MICVQAAAVVSSPVMLHTASTSVYPSSQLGVHLSPAGSEAEQLPSSSPFFALSGTADALHVICVQAAAAVSLPSVPHTASTSVSPSLQSGVQVSSAFSVFTQVSAPTVSFMFDGALASEAGHSRRHCGAVSTPASLHCAGVGVYPSLQLGVHDVPACSTSSGQSPLPFEFSGREKAHVFPVSGGGGGRGGLGAPPGPGRRRHSSALPSGHQRAALSLHLRVSGLTLGLARRPRRQRLLTLTRSCNVIVSNSRQDAIPVRGRSRGAARARGAGDTVRLFRQDTSRAALSLHLRVSGLTLGLARRPRRQRLLTLTRSCNIIVSRQDAIPVRGRSRGAARARGAGDTVRLLRQDTSRAALSIHLRVSGLTLGLARRPRRQRLLTLTRSCNIIVSRQDAIPVRGRSRGAARAGVTYATRISPRKSSRSGPGR